MFCVFSELPSFGLFDLDVQVLGCLKSMRMSAHGELETEGTVVQYCSAYKCILTNRRSWFRSTHTVNTMNFATRFDSSSGATDGSFGGSLIASSILFSASPKSTSLLSEPC